MIEHSVSHRMLSKPQRCNLLAPCPKVKYASEPVRRQASIRNKAVCDAAVPLRNNQYFLLAAAVPLIPTIWHFEGLPCRRMG